MFKAITAHKILVASCERKFSKLRLLKHVFQSLQMKRADKFGCICYWMGICKSLNFDKVVRIKALIKTWMLILIAVADQYVYIRYFPFSKSTFKDIKNYILCV